MRASPTPLVAGPTRGYHGGMRRLGTTAIAGLVLTALVVSAGAASAQVCGDADGNGTVTVSDGVQTLRAAVGLDSGCTVAACDVDGSGGISVTDGVSVLRKAVGLSAPDECGGGLAGQPATLLGELKAIFKYGVGFATGSPVTACANAPDGEIDVTVDEDGTATSFFACHVDDVELFGEIRSAATLLEFSVFESDTVGDEDFISDYDGELTVATAGAGKSLAGTLDVSTESTGLSTLTFAGATVAAGVLTGGTATVDLADSDIVDAFTQVVLTFDGSGVADVVATQAGGATTRLRYTIASGTAVPAS